VRIKAPDGFIIDRIIPSDSNDWLIEFFKPIAGGSFTEGERACFSVNPGEREFINGNC
jgi:hypothetical protein